jgi:hypothetical protein
MRYIFPLIKNAVAYAGYESIRDLRLKFLSLHFTETGSLLFFDFMSFHVISSELILSLVIYVVRCVLSSFLISPPLPPPPSSHFLFSTHLLSSRLHSSLLVSSSPLLSSPPHSSGTLCTAPSQCQKQS